MKNKEILEQELSELREEYENTFLKLTEEFLELDRKTRDKYGDDVEYIPDLTKLFNKLGMNEMKNKITYKEKQLERLNS